MSWWVTIHKFEYRWFKLHSLQYGLVWAEALLAYLTHTNLNQQSCKAVLMEDRLTPRVYLVFLVHIFLHVYVHTYALLPSIGACRLLNHTLQEELGMHLTKMDIS